jgi:hypothetical protein
MRIYQLLFLLFLLILAPFLSHSHAIDVMPWIENEVEMEIRAETLFQSYNSIQNPRHDFKRHEQDYFWTLSASFPFRNYRGEFEFTAAHTRHQCRRIDNYRISWCYQWLDDTLDDDPLSLMTGIILTEPMTRALQDVSSFHHGHIEGEFFLSFGQRFGPSCSKDYSFRYWNVCGVGTADFGSAWIREDAAMEFNDQDVQYLRLFTNTLWGLGRHHIRPQCFKGYGKIKHRSIDIGCRYGVLLGCFGTLSVQYARRVFTRNFPKNANLVLLEYDLPFGSQDPSTY